MNTSTDKYGNARFLHFRDIQLAGPAGERIDSNSGVTVAYAAADDGASVTWAEARCNWRDNYSKAIGRAKSFGRLKSATLAQKFNGTVQEFIAYIKEDIEAELGLKLHARHKKAA